MGVTGRVEHATAGVGHMGDDVNHLQRVHELHGGVAVTLQAEGDHAATAVGHVFHGTLVIAVVFQSRVVHPGHTRVVMQELSHGLRVFAVLSHTQVECLQAKVEDEGVHRCRYAAQVTHELGHEFGGIAHLAEGLDIGESVVALVGRAESRELPGMCHPVEVAAVHHSAADLRGRSVHILRCGVRHDVSAPLKGSAVDGCGKGVVDNQWHAIAVGHTGELLDVEHGATGVGDRLTEEQLRIGAEGSLQLFLRSIGVDKGALDAEFLHRHAKEVERTTIDLVGGHDMIAGLTDVEHGIEVGCLTA